MRIKANQREVKCFIKSGKKDLLVTFNANPIACKRCQEECVSDALIKLRLIRVDLPSGIEILVTNILEKAACPHGLFKSLYPLRWGIEENYKRLKQWVEIENFSGKSVRSIKQDFYAKILATNLATLITKAADEKAKNSLLDDQINFAHALSKLKHQMVKIIIDHQQRKMLITRTANYISQSIEAVRKGRTAPQKLKNIKNNIHYTAYKYAF